MRSTSTVHLSDDDEIRIVPTGGRPELEFVRTDLVTPDLRIRLTPDRLRRLQAVIAAYLAAYEPEYRPIAAEAATGAVVDEDDLFAAMAGSAEVD